MNTLRTTTCTWEDCYCSESVSEYCMLLVTLLLNIIVTLFLLQYFVESPSSYTWIYHWSIIFMSVCIVVVSYYFIFKKRKNSHCKHTTRSCQKHRVKYTVLSIIFTLCSVFYFLFQQSRFILYSPEKLLLGMLLITQFILLVVYNCKNIIIY